MAEDPKKTATAPAPAQKASTSDFKSMSTKKSSEIPDGYKEVIVPKDTLVWHEGGFAKPGTTVLLHEETLKRDPHLARAVKDKSEMPGPDMYDQASMASLKKALTNRDIQFESQSKEELASLARNHGVSQQELQVETEEEE